MHECKQNKNILYYSIHFIMQNLHLFEFLVEAIQCHMHHFQCLVVLEKLAAMKFVFWFGIAENIVFWFIVLGIAEICYLCYPNHHELENKLHRSQFHRDHQALKMVHMTPKSFC